MVGKTKDVIVQQMAVPLIQVNARHELRIVSTFAFTAALSTVNIPYETLDKLATIEQGILRFAYKLYVLGVNPGDKELGVAYTFAAAVSPLVR